MSSTSAYVLERREHPELRNEADLERLAKAEAKRKRKAERKAKGGSHEQSS